MCIISEHYVIWYISIYILLHYFIYIYIIIYKLSREGYNAKPLQPSKSRPTKRRLCPIAPSAPDPMDGFGAAGQKCHKDLKPHYNLGCEIVLGFFFWAGLGFFFGFLGWYHLPSVCNGLELEFVILHGIWHIWACSPSILHGIYYMWACSPSILYGICHILACSPSILHGISYMWACSPSILSGICHILACSPSILHGMFYMWACSPKYLQMRKLGIR